jgi:hypothetical protein
MVGGAIAGMFPSLGGPANVPRGEPAGTAGQHMANYAQSYFMSQGWSRAQAAGIAANLAQESSWNIHEVGDSGQARGIGQWHPNRQAIFRKVIGTDVGQASFQQQLAFVDWELKNSERAAGERLRGTRTAAEAGAAVSQYYERPADREREAGKRASAAAQLYAASPELQPSGGRIDISAAKGVNEAMVNAQAAAMNEILPPGYTARITSGEREEAGSQHALGKAADWQIMDPQGQPLRNRGTENYEMYRKWAVATRAHLMVTNPELAAVYSWGGHFGTALGGGGEEDLMHGDIGGMRGARYGGQQAEFADARVYAANLRQQANSIDVASVQARSTDRAAALPVPSTDVASAPAAEPAQPRLVSGLDLSRILQQPEFTAQLSRMQSTSLTNNNNGAGQVMNEGDRTANMNVTNNINVQGGGEDPQRIGSRYARAHERIYGDLQRNFSTILS